ncbi:helix-turn-helix domain-containing protein [Candidatus Wolfebacteria bacterium]|nr:helix-turn-helix domain-containing protein [Candidatus Wolfebacteria bacterium]
MVTHAPTRTLREVLMDGLEDRGLTVPRLAELTDIPERYLAAICEGDARRLPPAPYVRGYLSRIGDFLSIDGQGLWRLYKEEYPIRTAGVADRLPANRFAAQSAGKKWIFIVAGFIVMLYGVWRLPSFLGTPYLELTAPDTSPFVTRISPLDLSGRINSGDSLVINNESISVDASGRFDKQWPLEPGVNTLEFTVKKFLGREIKTTRQVIYQPQ